MKYLPNEAVKLLELLEPLSQRSIESRRQEEILIRTLINKNSRQEKRLLFDSNHDVVHEDSGLQRASRAHVDADHPDLVHNVWEPSEVMPLLWQRERAARDTMERKCEHVPTPSGSLQPQTSQRSPSSGGARDPSSHIAVFGRHPQRRGHSTRRRTRKHLMVRLRRVNANARTLNRTLCTSR